VAIETLKRQISAAVLTPVGRGAVATIRVAGDLSHLDRDSNVLFLAANARPLSQQPIGRIAFGQWSPDQIAGEDVVVCRTRPDVLEIHCHGGDAAVRRILADLNQADCEIVDWRQQQADSTGELEAECAEILSRASTWRTAEILHEQASGLLRRSVEELKILTATLGQSSSALVQLDTLLEWQEFGKHLSQAWTVVLTGRPNVGKSSLINALLGYQRAIVFDQPGTTRDVVTAETAFDGWPVLLADTAGLREATEELEAAGIALARERLEHADARLVLVDLSDPPTEDDATLIAHWPDAIIVGHKCDLADQWHDRLPTRALRASSVTGQGLDEIQRRLMDQLIPRVPPPGTPIPLTQRQASLLLRARNELAAGNTNAAQQTLEQILGR
jgi:tRNA modification GTPase